MGSLKSESGSSREKWRGSEGGTAKPLPHLMTSQVLLGSSQATTTTVGQPLTHPMTRQTVLLGSSPAAMATEGHQEVLSPREWSVLSYPLPEFPTSSHSLLATVHDDFNESHFHKSIYYSKKNVIVRTVTPLIQTPEM